MAKKIPLHAARMVVGSQYPKPYDEPCKTRVRHSLGEVAGLTQFGVNLTRIEPGGWSSQRHWHTVEEEFIYVLEGELTLVTDSGEEVLRSGDSAGFKAGDGDGHHLQNRGNRPALFLEIGSRRPDVDEAFYSDIDLHALRGSAFEYAHKDGRPYPHKARPESADTPDL